MTGLLGTVPELLPITGCTDVASCLSEQNGRPSFATAATAVAVLSQQEPHSTRERHISTPPTSATTKRSAELADHHSNYSEEYPRSHLHQLLGGHLSWSRAPRTPSMPAQKQREPIPHVRAGQRVMHQHCVTNCNTSFTPPRYSPCDYKRG